MNIRKFWERVEARSLELWKEDLAQWGYTDPIGRYIQDALEEKLAYLLQRKVEEVLMKLDIDPRWVRFSFCLYKGHPRGFSRVTGLPKVALEILARLEAQLEPQAEPRAVGASNQEEVRICM